MVRIVRIAVRILLEYSYCTVRIENLAPPG
jgi:hypothetical protein